MKKYSSALILLGILAIFFSVLVFILTFLPVVKEEVNYSFSPNQNLPIQPIDKDFGIVISKIKANSKIVANVNPYDQRQYQVALTKGVAHAKGTVFPGETGNIFLFSHSSVNFFEASRYNSIFYLLSKLEKDDEIDLYYKNNKFIYKVTDKKIVGPEAVSYLSGNTQKRVLTLMTCWPAGTTLKRLIILAELKD